MYLWSTQGESIVVFEESLCSRLNWIRKERNLYRFQFYPTAENPYLQSPMEHGMVTELLLGTYFNKVNNSVFFYRQTRNEKEETH